MELEKLNLYRDTSWNDINFVSAVIQECLPLHYYGPGTRPYYSHAFLFFPGRDVLLLIKTEYLIEEKQIFFD